MVVGLTVLLMATQAHAFSTADVTLNGSDATAVSGQISTNGTKGGLVDPSDFSAAFGGDAFTLLGQAGKGTASFSNDDPLSGILFDVSGSWTGISGTWALAWSGNDTPVTADFVVLLKAGNSYVAYFFDDVTLAAGGGSMTAETTWQIGFLNNGGNPANLSDMQLYVGDVTALPPVRDLPPSSEVPEPAAMLLFGTGLLGLSGLIRRKS